jgi:DNA processing protein
VLPGSLDNVQAIGCLRLLNNGAQVILSEEELLEMLGTMPQLDIHSAKVEPLPELEPELNSIFELINSEPVSLDFIVEKTTINTGQILAYLSQLELMGLVSQLPGMQYRRN